MWFLLAMSCTGKSNCTEEAKPSLVLSFVDSSGGEATPDSVEWYHNGAAMGEISLLSSEISIGSDVSGDFEVIIIAGEQMQSFNYTVEADECQVITVEAQIEILSALECDELEMPSVIVSGRDLSGAPLLLEEVLYSIDNGDSQQATCWNDCAEWIAGTEQSGDFEIVGFYTDPASGEELLERSSIQVEADECHVLTEEVILEFDVMSSGLECEELIDSDWSNYFEEQIGCGDVALYALMEGGFQQLTLQTTGLLDQLSVNTPLQLELSDSNVALILQFGEHLDERACNDVLSEEVIIDLEFMATAGTVTFTLHEVNDGTAILSAEVQDALLEDDEECNTLLSEYLWGAVTVGWLPGK